MCTYRLGIPPPCPIDDVAFTACTPESVGSTITAGPSRDQTIRLPLKRPRVMDEIAAAMRVRDADRVVPPPAPALRTSTKTYGRDARGRFLGRRRR